MNRPRRCGVIWVMAGLAALACLGGCMRVVQAPKLPPVISAQAAREVPAFDGRTGSRVNWQDLVAAAAGADAVLLGENHGHPLGLASAAALWEDVLTRNDRGTLAMEFFERDEQTGLDDYLSGVTDETKFRAAARRSAGNYPPGHRAMVESAKAHHRPVIAANAPRRYVRIARLEGYDRLAGLSEEQRRLFRVPDHLPGPESRYRRDFDAVMGGSDAAAKNAEPDANRRAGLDAVFRSQSMWDWTMAESVARASAAGNAPVVLVVGHFHVNFEGGLVQALRELRPGVRIVTVSFADASAFALREEDRNRADFVIYAGEFGPQ